MQQVGSIQNARTLGPDGREQLVTIEIRGDRIAAITPQEDAPVAPGEILDAAGGWLSPGFVDAHVHHVMSGLALQQLDLTGVGSRDAFAARIAAEHARLPADAWLLADGWLEADWAGELPNKSCSLKAVLPNSKRHLSDSKLSSKA